jgi:alkylation response protein AidB-like acyl-CoA dehydrogenase
MPNYKAPTRETLFVLSEVLKIGDLAHLPGYDMLDEDTVEAMIEEAGRFANEVLAPLNKVGDQHGCKFNPDGSVTTPPGFRDAYKQYCDAGWGTLALAEEFGGQDLPHVLHSAFEEYFAAANHGFMMYPGLTHGSVSAIMATGSQELQESYLPKLVSGEWLGTMGLTEPHAGTDLGLIRTRAEPVADGAYQITGTKIFLSGGEHDLTENIIHLVLAKTPGAPEGSRGISLFLVPKFFARDDGGVPQRNGVFCGSIEEKMGIHGSATCVMNFEGATGWLVGEENKGLGAMFVMMNAARLSVGSQGLGHAERAMQNASIYALERRQGRGMGERPDPDAPADPLIVHPDVRRLLLDARGFTEAMRTLILWGSVLVDLSHKAESDEARQEADDLVSFLTPVIKAHSSDRGFQTTVDMQQIYGGHGYTTDYGIEQIVRDARIPMIYEGANGVQAMDLAGRKLMRDGGTVAARFFTMIKQECEEAPADLSFIADPLGKAVHHGEAAAEWLLEHGKTNPNDLGSGSYAFLNLVGTLSLGLMWLRITSAASTMLASGEGDKAFLKMKLAVAKHYAEQQLPLCTAFRHRVKAGSANLMDVPADAFAPADR